MSVSEYGILTQIGSIDARMTWSNVKEVRDSGTYILIVGHSGNSFFVPSRAFRGAEERRELLSEIRRWHGAA